MEAKSPKLKEFIEQQNAEEFGMSTLIKKFISLEDKFEQDRYVELGNGEKKKLLVKDAIGEMHDNMKDITSKVSKIESAIQPLTDFTKLHKIMSKYHLYRLLGILFSIAIIKEIIFVALGK